MGGNQLSSMYGLTPADYAGVKFNNGGAQDAQRMSQSANQGRQQNAMRQGGQMPVPGMKGQSPMIWDSGNPYGGPNAAQQAFMAQQNQQNAQRAAQMQQQNAVYRQQHPILNAQQQNAINQQANTQMLAANPGMGANPYQNGVPQDLMQMIGAGNQLDSWMHNRAPGQQLDASIAPAYNLFRQNRFGGAGWNPQTMQFTS
jgi:hypothetical protein